ncbi:MAG: hypothetical protein K5880_11335 [Hydrogenophaga sp.]|jgi:hypothetical protein|uniref:hypothetical protein n=1 Tax=Hydrogenophaga sp. TaxID=1904254 RepID=UPI002632A2C1|nr:hypothetical protein [Hydrogenophaga sp.]MCV0439219.1 hypothetical protein [Hydrogenophaga sp.]
MPPFIPSLRRLLVVTLAATTLGLAGCGKTDPQAALEAAVQALQDNLEARDTSAVMDQLHASFQAGEGLDAEWARRTMTLMFLRYTNVRIVAVTRNSRIDSGSSQVGHTEARVLVTGAQGLIPERAEPYAVQLQWRLDGSDWKLIDLQWE